MLTTPRIRVGGIVSLAVMEASEKGRVQMKTLFWEWTLLVPSLALVSSARRTISCDVEQVEVARGPNRTVSSVQITLVQVSSVRCSQKSGHQVRMVRQTGN